MDLQIQRPEIAKFFERRSHPLPALPDACVQLLRDIQQGYTLSSSIPYHVTVHRLTAAPPMPRSFHIDAFPADTVAAIRSTLPYEIRYTFEIPPGIPVKLRFFVSALDGGRRPWRVCFAEYARRVCVWLLCLTQYAESHCVRSLTIYVYATSLKKTLPADPSRPLGESHVNTAFTQSCVGDNAEIVIYRSEEWFKVLIHETFHTFGLDFSTADPSVLAPVYRAIQTVFPVASKVNAYEGYTEFWAEIANAAFVSLLLSPTTTDAHRRMQTLLAAEQAHSACQLAKVLRHMGLVYDDFFSDPARARIAYKENTNVLAYFVIKHILLFHLDATLALMRQINPRLLQSPKTQDGLQKWAQFVVQHASAADMKQQIHDAAVTAASAPGDEPASLRMSLYELQ